MRVWLRTLTLAALVGFSLGLSGRYVYAQESTASTILEAAERHGVDGPYLVRVARCESNLNPRAVGRAGEQGLAQLHPRGLLPVFYSLGYDDPFNAWESADFLAWAFSQGMSRHWSCR